MEESKSLSNSFSSNRSSVSSKSEDSFTSFNITNDERNNIKAEILALHGKESEVGMDIEALLYDEKAKEIIDNILKRIKPEVSEALKRREKREQRTSKKIEGKKATINELSQEVEQLSELEKTLKNTAKQQEQAERSKETTLKAVKQAILNKKTEEAKKNLEHYNTTLQNLADKQGKLQKYIESNKVNMERFDKEREPLDAHIVENESKRLAEVKKIDLKLKEVIVGSGNGAISKYDQKRAAIGKDFQNKQDKIERKIEELHNKHKITEYKAKLLELHETQQQIEQQRTLIEREKEKLTIEITEKDIAAELNNLKKELNRSKPEETYEQTYLDMQRPIRGSHGETTGEYEKFKKTSHYTDHLEKNDSLYSWAVVTRNECERYQFMQAGLKEQLKPFEAYENAKNELKKANDTLAKTEKLLKNMQEKVSALELTKKELYTLTEQLERRQGRLARSNKHCEAYAKALLLQVKDPYSNNDKVLSIGRSSSSYSSKKSEVLEMEGLDSAIRSSGCCGGFQFSWCASIAKKLDKFGKFITCQSIPGQ